MRRGALVEAAATVEYRHAFDVRHPTYEEVTASFVYVRLHGSQELYASGYTDEELDVWAARIDTWRRGSRGGRDVYVYFDNDAKVHAPFDARRLRERMHAHGP